MKKYFVLFVIMSFLACSETQLIDYWKSPEVDTYSPNKILIVGLTSDVKARIRFENQLQKSLKEKGIEATQSSDLELFSVKDEKLALNELNTTEAYLLSEGFDTILLSYVVGVEDKIAYTSNDEDFDETYRRFKEDFLRYQDMFYNPEYYEEYTVYHAETAMYCICPEKERELIWKGNIDITDPRELDKTVNQYVNLVIMALEELNLLDPFDNNSETNHEMVY